MESEFNWTMKHNQIVESSSNLHIPLDIAFKFEDTENEIQAHKMMMGMVSPVFHNMFFVSDTKDKNAKELLLKGTTFGAFNITRNAIYGITSMENGLKGKSVREVFSVLDLVTRYQILELQKIVRNHLKSLSLTDDTVLEVAAIAMEKTSTFEDEAKELLILCSKFIKPKLKNAQTVFEYVADHQDDMEIVYTLLALMKENGPIASPICPNCGKEPCQHGTDIEESQFRKGLIVTTNDNDCWYLNEKGWGQAVVTEVQHNDSVFVKGIKDGEYEDDDLKNNGCNMAENGQNTFKFDCK